MVQLCKEAQPTSGGEAIKMSFIDDSSFDYIIFFTKTIYIKEQDDTLSLSLSLS